MSALKQLGSFAAGSCLLAASGLAQADFIDNWVNGFWVPTGENVSRGLGIDYFRTGPEVGVAFAAYYTYDDAGNATWFTVIDANVEADEFVIEGDLVAFEGGTIDPGDGPIDNPSGTVVGTATITMNSCTSVTVEVDGTAVDSFTAEFTPGEVPLGASGKSGPSQCVYKEAFDGCPDFANAGPEGSRICSIPAGEYTEDLLLTNNTLWFLEGAVYIGQRATQQNPNPGNDNTLTIEPGTRVIGGDGSTLLGIQPGAEIYAEGLPHAPIVFTGQDTASGPEGERGQAGDWGGLTINGLAPLNTCNTPGQCTSEGEGESGVYGGDDPYDSSGVLRYVRVQFAGFRFNDTNELNGIAFQGVGARTVLENIQVHANEDDGVEFFGGTANARNVVLTGIRDDSLDWTEGWRGRVQGLVVIQDQNFDAIDAADRGIEADNLEDNEDNTPRAKPWIANATFVGRPDTSGWTIRRGTGANITNSIVTGFSECLDIDGASTFNAAVNNDDPTDPTGNLTIQNTIFNCDTSFDEEDGDPWSIRTFVENFAGNSEDDPGLVDLVFPPEGADYLADFEIDYVNIDAAYDDAGFVPADGFFDSFFSNYGYIGAFFSQDTAWALGWTLQDFGDVDPLEFSTL